MKINLKTHSLWYVSSRGHARRIDVVNWMEGYVRVVKMKRGPIEYETLYMNIARGHIELRSDAAVE